jgi:hypothetical protein
MLTRSRYATEASAALMALARKLVRVCYALLERQVSFDPGIRPNACNAT